MGDDNFVPVSSIFSLKMQELAKMVIKPYLNERGKINLGLDPVFCRENILFLGFRSFKSFLIYNCFVGVILGGFFLCRTQILQENEMYKRG